MKRTLGGTSIYRADYIQLLLNTNSSIVLDKTYIAKLVEGDKSHLLEMQAVKDSLKTLNSIKGFGLVSQIS